MIHCVCARYGPDRASEMALWDFTFLPHGSHKKALPSAPEPTLRDGLDIADGVCIENIGETEAKEHAPTSWRAPREASPPPKARKHKEVDRGEH